MKNVLIKALSLLLLGAHGLLWAQPASRHDLHFDHLAPRWDEAMPLGNGMMGVLIWEKNNRLRLTLDRADLWDERKAMDLSKFNFKWVEQQVLKNDYEPVHQLGDHPYDMIPYPTKLPAAAIEFDIRLLGRVVSNHLDIQTGLNTVKFENGTIFKCYVHAIQNVGYFSFENIPATLKSKLLPDLMTHTYNGSVSKADNDNSHAGQGLEKLGYAQGTVKQSASQIRYHQPTYEGHFYEVLVEWQNRANNQIIGSWTIIPDKLAQLPVISATAKEPTGWDSHLAWWKKYWAQSSVKLPDAAIEKQYYLDMYKLGCTARSGAPAITLQAIWTADNGSLPPWKGDFHNDLNTQLSYWPTYTGNRLTEGATFTDWLWKIREKNKAYTQSYFGVEGLNVPGTVTLNGDPMGGWIQYSLSPTVSAWCAQHFYWQWKYAMDDRFLKDRAYHYIHDAATYLENITKLKDGIRKLPLSSSPEYNDNRVEAWFKEWSNFDLSLAKYLFTIAEEIALVSGKKSEAAHWRQILLQLPDYESNETGFTVAPGQNLNDSHRHMSQYMAIYPLALLDVNQPKDKALIESSLRRIEEKGTRAWCGYSFSWMASLYARAYQGDSALKHLRIFTTNFCSPNSFHLNGDQKGGEYSNMTYRPFTLEGNFAFAQGVHELLLQSRNGYVEVFPALPSAWKNVSFKDLRAEGAFLIGAQKTEGNLYQVEVKAEKDGILKMKLPSAQWGNAGATVSPDGFIHIPMKKGQKIRLSGRG